jgi:hypothetical protein
VTSKKRALAQLKSQAYIGTAMPMADEIEAAQADYKRAVYRYSAASALVVDALQSGVVPTSEGTQSVEQARLALAAARKRYFVLWRETYDAARAKYSA